MAQSSLAYEVRTLGDLWALSPREQAMYAELVAYEKEVDEYETQESEAQYSLAEARELLRDVENSVHTWTKWDAKGDDLDEVKRDLEDAVARARDRGLL